METNVKIIDKDEKVAAVTHAVDEAVARESYDLSVDIELDEPALLKVTSTASGNIKFTYAGKNATVTTMDALEVNEANIHVIKVWKTGTTIATTDFYLYQ